MGTYQPKPYTLRAVQWRGNPADLPSDWLASGLLTIEPDGVAVCRTKHGPAAAGPDGSYYIVELPDQADSDELYPVRRDIFEAKYEAAE